MNPLNKDEFMRKMELSEQDLKYSENAVKRFWNWMYSDEDGIVQVCAFPVPTENKDASELGKGKWVHARTYNEFEDFCRIHSDLWRYHVYSGVNLLNKKPSEGRGDVKLIDEISHLSFDIETERESYCGASKEEVWWCYKYGLAQAKHIKEKYGALPIVVMSENGIHLHYKVDFKVKDELLDNKQHIYCKYLTFEARNSKWAQKVREEAPPRISFDQDDVSDVPRVMKVAGTRGIKSEQGRMCGIIHQPSKDKAGIISHSQLEVTDMDIQRMDQKTSKSQSDKSKDKIKVETDIGSLDDNDVEGKIKHLMKNDSTFGKLWHGDCSEYKSRSEAEFAFIVKMLSHDFSPDEIVNVMWSSGMSKWKEETDHYRKKTVNNAIDYFDGDIVRGSQDASINFDKR